VTSPSVICTVAIPPIIAAPDSHCPPFQKQTGSVKESAYAIARRILLEEVARPAATWWRLLTGMRAPASVSLGMQAVTIKAPLQAPVNVFSVSDP
jgi:hypothetical protein